MSMFLLLFALTTLCGIVNEKAENIKICAIPVSSAQNPPNFLMRPSVPVENCQDRDAAAFSLINSSVALKKFSIKKIVSIRIS